MTEQLNPYSAPHQQPERVDAVDSLAGFTSSTLKGLQDLSGILYAFALVFSVDIVIWSSAVSFFCNSHRLFADFPPVIFTFPLPVLGIFGLLACGCLIGVYSALFRPRFGRFVIIGMGLLQVALPFMYPGRNRIEFVCFLIFACIGFIISVGCSVAGHHLFGPDRILYQDLERENKRRNTEQKRAKAENQPIPP